MEEALGLAICVIEGDGCDRRARRVEGRKAGRERGHDCTLSHYHSVLYQDPAETGGSKEVLGDLSKAKLSQVMHGK